MKWHWNNLFSLEFFSFPLLITIPPLLSAHQCIHQGDLECIVTSVVFTSGASFMTQLSAGCREWKLYFESCFILQYIMNRIPTQQA
jgi:hypothetical protein